MKKILFILFCPIFLLAIQGSIPLAELEKANPEHEVQTIQILIKKNIDGALVDVKNGYQVINPENQKKLSSGSKGKRYYLQTTPKGLKWGEGYIGIHQIKIVPKNQATSILIDGIQYKGSLGVYDVNGQIQLVNEIDVEDALKAILSYHCANTSYQSATYDALAIALRTHLYDIIFRRQNPYWDVQAEEVKYLGGGAVLIKPEIERAVNGTRHLIMTYLDKPFPTSWTENSAGKTASYVDVFRKKSDTPPGVLVAFSQKVRESHKWKCILPNELFAKLLHLDTIKEVDLYQDPQAKKTYALSISDGKNFVELTFAEFQKLIGENRILSNDIHVHILKDNTVFEGYGQGLGVGLCLLSADEMAKMGDSAMKILNYFYPDTFIVKLGKIPESLIGKM